jgi:SAM-dependent methyltransferase
VNSFRDEEYWNKAANEFATYYREEKDALRRAIDKIFRKSMKERYDLTLRECRNVNGKNILDIGGNFEPLASELRRKGAQITNIKLQPSKIELDGRKLFLEADFSQDFDLTLALGLFDYVEDSAPYLEKMRRITEEKCIMSFPSYAAFQMPLRMIWMRSRKYPVYFYTKSRVKKLVATAFSRYRVKNISAGYHCVAHP